MKKIPSMSVALLMLLPTLMMAQIGVTGDITPAAMFRVSDGSLIDLPFRLGNVMVNYAWGDFEIKTSTALETRWKNPDMSGDMLQFREAYLLWYPSFGEIKLGKMIHTWGAADANNPTDNLSAYDFYYMFLSGTDRKLGNLSVAAKLYYDDWQAEAVFTPEGRANRLPFGEPDFPISFPFEPETYAALENPAEYGLRLRRAFSSADVSLSALRTHDQIFSVFSMTQVAPGVRVPQFGYRNTDVLGMDFVAFPGNWTVRGEGGYFQTVTPDPDPNAFLSLPVDASYFQYVFQVEYQFANQVSVMGQFLGTEVNKAEGATLDQITYSPTLLTKDNFSAGLGTPFGMISDRVMILSSMATFLDNRLDLSGMLMVNLEETGTMANLGAAYSIRDGLSLELALAYFVGGDEPGNSFKQLEDFSHLNVGLIYSF